MTSPLIVSVVLLAYKTKVKETAPLLNDKGDTEMVEVVRNRWVIDREPPIFSQERGYVEKGYDTG